MKTAYCYACRNHESHDNPSFGIEKSKGTVLVFFLRNPAGMFPVEPMENEPEEKQEYKGSFAGLEQPVRFIMNPAGYSDSQDIDSGNQPHDTGSHQQGFSGNSVFHDEKCSSGGECIVSGLAPGVRVQKKPVSDGLFCSSGWT